MRLFGGEGIHHEDLNIALEVDGRSRSRQIPPAPGLEATGNPGMGLCRPGPQTTAMPFWSVPESALDGPEETVPWAREALEMSRRARRWRAMGPGIRPCPAPS